jgi:VanZ family protein
VAATKKDNPFMRFINFWLPVIIYAIFIFSMSSIPGDSLPSLFRFQDVFGHLLEYMVFGILIRRAMKAYYPGMVYGVRLCWVLFISLAYAATDELHQSFIPSRTPSFVDIAYDGLGVVLANIIAR